jgi:hypothetical protein
MCLLGALIAGQVKEIIELYQQAIAHLTAATTVAIGIKVAVQEKMGVNASAKGFSILSTTKKLKLQEVEADVPTAPEGHTGHIFGQID